MLRLVLGEGLGYALAGVGIGFALALATARLIGSVLYGISARDPLTFAGATLVLIGVALLASYIPARVATKVQPMEPLRYE